VDRTELARRRSSIEVPRFSFCSPLTRCLPINTISFAPLFGAAGTPWRRFMRYISSTITLHFPQLNSYAKDCRESVSTPINIILSILEPRLTKSMLCFLTSGSFQSSQGMWVRWKVPERHCLQLLSAKTIRSFEKTVKQFLSSWRLRPSRRAQRTWWGCWLRSCSLSAP